MKCSKCQHENPEDARFCMGCGHNLTLLSESAPKDLSFDEKIDKIQRYLPKGLTEKILSQKEKIEGERKQVTVMFCDMEGFTPLVEKLGSEEAYAIMDQVYEILIHKVHDYEGTVNEMTGDGIMALFGAPIALEDAPQRALQSALAIHDEIAKFNENRKGMDPIKMRIGVHTGPVIVGTLGNDLRVEFKAVGDTVNLASRMEGIAEPGTTYVTQDTFKLTKGLFRFEAIGERSVKGKESAVQVYKLLSAKKDVHRPRLGLERSIYSEMVGRDKELNKLELQVMKAINGEGSIVNIIGEAGIGKSRLVAELKNREMIKQVYLFEGRAISTGRKLSFHPIIDLLKQWARIGEDDSGAAALSKLEIAIRQVCPEEMDEVLPFVATLMGMKLSGRYAERIKGIEGEALEKLILKNMRDLIIKATELKPHVIIIEDLQWADTSSIELMESLFRLAESQRIVFINVFRPSYNETGDRIVKTIKEKYALQYVEINLQPLDKKNSVTLINNMLQIKGLKHVVVDQIVKRSDGNPFFLEEVVRSFIDQGAVVQKNGAFEVTEKIDTMIIPNTINDVLMARIDCLEEKTRDLIKVASVIGRSFFYRILKEVSITIGDIDERISHLKDIQLLRERKRMDELEYLFKHALAQEAAYQSILQQTRMNLHTKVANSIEKVFKERLHEFYGMLAYHYSKGEDFDKAEEYMIKAGEEALSSAASSEALRYYQDALDLYQKKYGETADPEKLALLEGNIATALFNKAEFETALEYFDSTLKRWSIKPTKNKILILTKLFFNLLMVIVKLWFPLKRSLREPTQKDRDIINLNNKKNYALTFVDPIRMFAETMENINRILKLDLNKLAVGYETLCTSSILIVNTGLFWLTNRLIKYCGQFIDGANLKQLFYLRIARDVHNTWLGRWDDDMEYKESILEDCLRVGNPMQASTYLLSYCWIRISKGVFAETFFLLDRLSKIYDDYEHKMAKQLRLNLELMLFNRIRALSEAKRTLEKFESSFEIASDSMSLVFLSQKAQFQFLINDYDGAEKTLRLAEKGFKEEPTSSVPAFIIWYLHAGFELELSFLEISILKKDKLGFFKNRKQADKICKRLLKNSNKFAIRRPEAFLLAGRYFWLVNKQKSAEKWWKRSIEECKQLGARPDLARTYMEIGKRFSEEKSKYKELNGISASEYLEKAKTMFQEMGLQWDLDQLERIAA